MAPEMIKDRIADPIRRLLFEESEMTQQQLADKVGVTHQDTRRLSVLVDVFKD